MRAKCLDSDFNLCPYNRYRSHCYSWIDDVRISYLVLAHNTPNHLRRLVHALESPNSVFFIHVDRKFDISPFEEGLSQYNVTFLEDRVAVHWGDFSDVEATIKLIGEALDRSPDSGYLCLLKRE